MKRKAQNCTPTTRIVAFGDIHGCVGAANAAIGIAEEGNYRAVFLGDYVDKGESSMGVLNKISEAQSRHPEWVFLLGNHDKMLMDVIAGKRHPKGFDERTLNESFPMYQSAKSADQNRYMKALQRLTAFHESQSFIFLHGGFTQQHPDLSCIPTEELVWTYDIPEEYQGKMVVRGHNPVERPVFAFNNININTGCGYGGFLTALILDDNAGRALECFSISEDGSQIKPLAI
jgi:serine/threonine protein phosphatase 1